jgi:hypothetical protein
MVGMRLPVLSLLLTLVSLVVLQVVAVTTGSRVAARASWLLLWAVPPLALLTLGQELYRRWQASGETE